jgi:Ser/Thr protein kinase RdoA (MazF antagonist)
MLGSVLAQYALPAQCIEIVPFGNGLIHHTYKVTTTNDVYILQQLNLKVFTEPALLAHNIGTLTRHLAVHAPGYVMPTPLANAVGGLLTYHVDGSCYRLTRFVNGAHSKDTVGTTDQAYQAAHQFGRFAARFSDLDPARLHITIPGFHDLDLRYTQFCHATRQGNPSRIRACSSILNTLKSHKEIVTQYLAIVRGQACPLRVMHHDTKISNVLFDVHDKGLCVIDLDTVMPGYFMSDVGDMMRTYLSAADENASNFNDIEIRVPFYKAIQEGYLSALGQNLTALEREQFFFSGAVMMFMQALRFITDYLQDDVYYGAKFPEQNLMRAKNQLVLLNRYFDAEKTLHPFTG